MSAREAVQQLLDGAVADGAHPERIAALRDALAAVTEWQKSTARYQYDHEQISRGRSRRNDASIARAKQHRTWWTQRELEMLDPELSIPELARRIGRSERAVAHKIAALRQQDPDDIRREAERDD